MPGHKCDLQPAVSIHIGLEALDTAGASGTEVDVDRLKAREKLETAESYTSGLNWL